MMPVIVIVQLTSQHQTCFALSALIYGWKPLIQQCSAEATLNKRKKV